MIHVLTLVLYKFFVYSSFFLTFFLLYFLLSISFLSYLFTSLYFLVSASSRIDPLHFQSGCRRRRPNVALIFLVHFML